MVLKLICTSNIYFVYHIYTMQAAIPPTTLNKVTLSAEDKAYLVQQLEDEELAKTVEEIVEGLDDEQLEKLETILAKVCSNIFICPL